MITGKNTNDTYLHDILHSVVTWPTSLAEFVLYACVCVCVRARASVNATTIHVNITSHLVFASLCFFYPIVKPFVRLCDVDTSCFQTFPIFFE